MQWNQNVENDLEKVNSKKIVYHSRDWMLKLVITPPPRHSFRRPTGHGDREGLCCRVFGGIIQQFSSILWLESSRDWPRLNVLFLFFFIAAIVNLKKKIWGIFGFVDVALVRLYSLESKFGFGFSCCAMGPWLGHFFPKCACPLGHQKVKILKRGKENLFGFLSSTNPRHDKWIVCVCLCVQLKNHQNIRDQMEPANRQWNEKKKPPWNG